MKRIVWAVVLAIAVFYAGDYIFLRIRMAKGQTVHDTVQVQRYYAVAEKNNKVEFMYDQPDSRECVRALFSHFGDSPCWVVRRHTEERIDE